MEIRAFYAVTAATCFTLVELWWSVVKYKKEWYQGEATRLLAGGVYASFLISVFISAGVKIGGTV